MKSVIFILMGCFQICFQVSAQWSVIDVGTTKGLFSVHFINTDTGFICGTNTLLQSFDGGDNWSTVSSVNVSGYQLYAMHFPTKKVGYIAGPFIVLKTEDAGVTWINITPSDAGYLYDVQFLNNDTGVVCGDSKYFKTLNGGQTWQEIHPSTPFGISYEYIQFLNYDTAYLCSHEIGDFLAALLKSTDGGLNWDFAFPLPFSSPASFQPYKVFQFLDSDTGYAGVGGGIYKTIDGGDSWTLTSFPGTMTTLYFLSTDSGYSTGYDYSSLGSTIYKTFDGGNTWYHCITPYPDSNYYIIEMSFLNMDQGYAVGSNGLFMKTNNGGGFLGIEQLSNVAFSVFPNPAGDEFNLITSERGQLWITNEVGQMMQYLKVQRGKSKILSSKFPSDTYFLTFQTDKSIRTKKLLVRH